MLVGDGAAARSGQLARAELVELVVVLELVVVHLMAALRVERNGTPREGDGC